MKNAIFYYADYAYEGSVILHGQNYRAMFVDELACGDFRPKPQPGRGTRLLIDLNGDGKFDQRNEMFEPGKPFNIRGATWQIIDLTIAGDFKITQSKQAVAELPTPLDLSVGRKALPFKATRMDGKVVNFPADYKGRIVLLDFWATWCGPCMADAPSLVKAYEEFHPRGLDVLGVSLDKPDITAKVKEVLAANAMRRPQIYDGKFWQATIAKQYEVGSIPAAFLIDGETGEILATGESLQGELLGVTLRANIAKKYGK